MDIREVGRYLEAHRDDMLADLRDFVERETPSEDKELLDAFADYLAEYAERRFGGRSTIHPDGTAGNQVLVRWGEDQEEDPLLLLGHYDTVWPAGTLRSMPFSVRGDVASGPGVFDMKCGLVQGLWAVRALRQAGVRRGITLLCNSDEELGSPYSRPLVEDAALESRATLVMEPSLDGALKTSRKGESRYLLRVTGRAAHTGLDPERGISAVEELARLVLELHGYNEPDRGTTVNVGVIEGGSRHNVVAAEAAADVDVRFASPEEERRVDAMILGIRASRPEIGVEVDGAVEGGVRGEGDDHAVSTSIPASSSSAASSAGRPSSVTRASIPAVVAKVTR